MGRQRTLLWTDRAADPRKVPRIVLATWLLAELQHRCDAGACMPALRSTESPFLMRRNRYANASACCFVFGSQAAKGFHGEARVFQVKVSAIVQDCRISHSYVETTTQRQVGLRGGFVDSAACSLPT